MEFVKASIAIIYLVISGFGVARLILKDKIDFSLFGWLPLSFVLGFGLMATWASIIMIFGLKLSFLILVLPFLFFFAYGFLQLKAMLLAKEFKIPSFEFTPLQWFLIGVTVFAVGFVFLRSVVFPMHFWDSRAIWSLKAKMFFESGTVFSENFLSPMRVQPHIRYPLLFPLSQAFIYLSIGMIDDWVVMLLIGLFFPLMVSFLFDLLRILTNKTETALLGSATLALLPLYYLSDGPAYSGYADTPLALFYLVSFGALLLWRVKQDRKLLIVGLITSAFLPLVKNEGMVLLLLNIGWVFLPDYKKWPDLIRNLLLFLLISILILVPWFVIRSQIPEVNEQQYLTHLRPAVIIKNLDRVPMIATYYVRAFLGLEKPLSQASFMWGGLWLIMLVAAGRSFWERRKIEIGIFLMIILNILAMALIHLISPGELTGGFLAVTVFRVTCSITPLLIILIALNMASQINQEQGVK